MLPDVLVAAALFVALLLSSFALAQIVADFVVFRSLSASHYGSSGTAAWEDPTCCDTPDFVGGNNSCSC